jgi:hypothetical protein
MSLERDLGEGLHAEEATAEAPAVAPGKRELGSQPRDVPAAPGKRTISQGLPARDGAAGQPLPAALRTRFEGSLGVDLGEVRVHTGGEAGAEAGRQGARAFAVGQDIAFAGGQYDPDSPRGQRLLAHEVAHTVQQRDAPYLPMYKLQVGSQGDPLELEADRVAVAMLSGAPAPALTPAPRSIQRDPGDDEGGPPFEYRPAQALDRVFSETSTFEQIAAELYGRESLASELTEVAGTPRSFRFRPELLVARWRAVYYEHRARARVRAEVDGEAVTVLPTTPGPGALVEAVVIYSPAADCALGPAALTVDPITGGAPAVDEGAVPPPATTATDAVVPDETTVYDAPLDYGQSIGEIDDIVDHPQFFSATFERPEDDAVLVTIDPGGPYADLITPQMTFPVLLPVDAPAFDPSDPLGLGSIGTLEPPTLDLGPLAEPPPEVRPLSPRDGGLDLAALSNALASRTGAEGGEAGPLRAVDRLPVLVLDPSGEAAMYGEDRFTVVRGPGATALIGGMGAPSYLWDGGSSLQPVSGLTRGALGEGLPDLGHRRRLGATDLGADPNPFDPIVTSAYRVEWVHYQVMTVRELRALVRRHTTQDLLNSVADWEGHAISVGGDRLADIGTSETAVHGTVFDRDDHGESLVEIATRPTSTDPIDGAAPSSLSEADILDRFDLAESMVADAAAALPSIRELVLELGERLRGHRERMAANPRSRGEYGNLISNVMRLVPGCRSQKRAIGQMISERRPERDPGTPEHPIPEGPPDRCIIELQEISDMYSLALAYSDQEASSRQIYDAANMRVVMFPMFEVQVRGEEAGAGTDDILDEEGDDSIFMGLSVEGARHLTRAFSLRANATDVAALHDELERARTAMESGDGTAASEHQALAHAIAARMQGRFIILQQLHQALIGFQAIGGSAARFGQPLFEDDDILEQMIRDLLRHLEDFESAETPEDQVRILGEVQTMWESSEQYRAFYNDLQDFLDNVDFGVRLGIVVAAGLVSMGVGSALTGAGVGAVGTLFAEAAAFTVVDRVATASLTPDLSERMHPTDDGGAYAAGLAGEFALNLTGVAVGRGVSRMWRGLGRDMSTATRMGGELATNLLVNQAMGVGVHALTHEGELPTMDQFVDMGEDNAINLTLMTIAGLLTRRVFTNIHNRAAELAPGGASRRMRMVMDRSAELRTEIDTLRTRMRETPGEPSARDQRRLGRLQNEANELQAETQQILEGLEANPTWRRHMEANPDVAEGIRQLGANVRAGLETAADLAFAARVGLRSPGGGDGGYLLFNPGRTELVAEWYRLRDYEVTTTETDGRAQITATRRGEGSAPAERLVLREARESYGEAFAAALEAAPATTFRHGGTEVHNHFNGIATAGDFVEGIYGGSYEAAARDLRARFERYRASRNDRIRELLVNREAPRADTARIDTEITEIRAELARDAPTMEALTRATQDGASPESVRRAVENALEASSTAGFDVTYRVRGAVFDPEFDPALADGAAPDAEARARAGERVRAMVEATLRRLAADGVRDVEVQGRLPGGMSESEFQRLCGEHGLTVRFLRVVSTTEFSVYAPERSDAGDLTAEITEALGPGALLAGDGMQRLATEMSHLPPSIRDAVMQMLRSPSMAGMDIAGPERHMFTGPGMQNLTRLYRVLTLAHQATGRQYVLRPHVGEGYAEHGTPDADSPGSHADVVSTARHNIDSVLRALRRIRYQPDQGVTVRLGHVTHATEAQIRAMADLGVIAEVNLGSNLATGSITSLAEHPLLMLLYHGVDVILSTDAGGVMRTDLDTEYGHAETMINEFRNGTRNIEIGGREVTFDSIRDTPRARRFTLEHLRATAESYRRSIAEHRPATTHDRPNPPATTDDDEDDGAPRESAGGE